MWINKKLKWALVLSGGGAKGFAHVGVLKAFAEMGFPEPSLVVGTSMGAIVGGLYASGMTPGDLYRFVREEFDIAKYLDSFVFKLSGPVGKVLQAGQFLGSLTVSPGIDSGERILSLLEELSRGKTFERLRIPFRCNAVDLTTGKEVVFRSGSVARAIRASISFPIFFEPHQEGGMCLVDGGIVNNMPVGIPREEGYKRILAVDVGAFRLIPGSNFKTGYKIVYRSLEVLLNRIRERRYFEKPELLIYASDDATPFSFFRKNELLDLGERVVRENERAVTAFFSCGLDALAIRRRHPVCGFVSGNREEHFAKNL
jgi:NTE family protein